MLWVFLVFGSAAHLGFMHFSVCMEHLSNKREQNKKPCLILKHPAVLSGFVAMGFEERKFPSKASPRTRVFTARRGKKGESEGTDSGPTSAL